GCAGVHGWVGGGGGALRRRGAGDVGTQPPEDFDQLFCLWRRGCRGRPGGRRSCLSRVFLLVYRLDGCDYPEDDAEDYPEDEFQNVGARGRGQKYGRVDEH
ncbi:MAG TPA: hypothetical protein P5169_05175, partial [Kiritimatiellia bacterium]|nr:hypothetical protein [Kiritimatiellia bacterium]